MRNLKLEIEYDGTNYCGWQSQGNHQSRHRHKTIQETVEGSLQQILQEKIKLIASGRTDAGVHAKAQIANFKTSSNMSINRLHKAINGNLPADITISRIEKVSPDFHSRFCAKSKLYRYTILNRLYPSALLRERAYFYPYPLNIKLMQRESKILLGRHNFSSFQASQAKERNPVKTIKKIRLIKDKGLIYIDIEADGFLYNMVRSIVGTLIEIGRLRFPEGSLKRILLSQDRKLAGPTVPAKGLCLIKVKY